MHHRALYSCDDHLDLTAVPPDLWAERLPRALHERAPRVVTRDGARVWVCDDVVLGRSGSPGTGSSNAIGRAGLPDDGYRASDPVARLEDMDLDGVTASVIYGPAVFSLPIADPELKHACYAAFNDFGIEFNSHAPDRLCMLARIPGTDPERARAELARCATLGHRGAILEVFGTDLADPAWDGFWSLAADGGIPISFHLGGGTSQVTYRVGQWGAPAYSTVAPMQLDEPLTTVVFSGVLSRHPGLRLVLAESGVGWLPYLVARMDHEWRIYRGAVGNHELEVPPSELVGRQVMATLEEEPLAAVFIPMLGTDKVMWASDYPHPDSTFPDSRSAVERAFAGFSDDDVERLVARNCAELYGFPIT